MLLSEFGRARSLYELAISQAVLDMPEAVWKAYIDFEIAQVRGVVCHFVLPGCQMVRVNVNWLSRGSTGCFLLLTSLELYVPAVRAHSAPVSAGPVDKPCLHVSSS